MESVNPTKIRIASVLGALILALLLSVTVFAVDAKAELDVPDCAPCHGDAHKPGEDNPHGYGASQDDSKETEEVIESKSESAGSKKPNSEHSFTDSELKENVFFGQLSLSCPDDYMVSIIEDTLYLLSPEEDDRDITISISRVELDEGDEISYDDIKKAAKTALPDSAQQITFTDSSINNADTYHISCSVGLEDDASATYLHQYYILSDDVYIVSMIGADQEDEEFISSDLAPTLTVGSEGKDATYTRIAMNLMKML